jgi:hypothetical protein
MQEINIVIKKNFWKLSQKLKMRNKKRKFNNKLVHIN